MRRYLAFSLLLGLAFSTGASLADSVKPIEPPAELKALIENGSPEERLQLFAATHVASCVALAAIGEPYDTSLHELDDLEFMAEGPEGFRYFVNRQGGFMVAAGDLGCKVLVNGGDVGQAAIFTSAMLRSVGATVSKARMVARRHLVFSAATDLSGGPISHDVEVIETVVPGSDIPAVAMSVIRSAD